jgi:hypothetical protein
MIAHLILRDGRWTWSGYNASGDPAHRPYALVADIGRDFLITGEGKLYLIGPRSPAHDRPPHPPRRPMDLVGL